MGFDTTALDKDYEYDFTKHRGPSGRIPMPSTEEISKFRAQFYAAQEIVTGISIDNVTSDEKREELAKRLAELTAEERDQMYAGNREAVIDVCNGSPSRDVLDKLPAPVQMAFVNYVAGLLAPLF